MKKSSREIYKELLTQRTIDTLEDKIDFLRCVRNVKEMNSNELMSSSKLGIYANKYPELKEYVNDIFDEVERKIIDHLDTTKEGFKGELDRMEEMEKEIK